MTSDIHSSRWKREFPISTAHLDIYGNLRAANLVDMLQEAAFMHAAEINLGFESIFDNGYTWMLARMKLDFGKWPAASDILTVSTWPAGTRRRMIAVREYGVTDPDGQCILQGTSDWLFVDTRKQRIARFIPQVASVLDSTRPLYDEAPPFPATAPGWTPQWTVDIPVRRSDIDINRHVNNIHYVSWLTEPLPEEWQMRTLTGIDVSYRVAAKYGDTLVSAASPTDEGSLHHRITRRDDGAILCEAYSSWDIQEI